MKPTIISGLSALLVFVGVATFGWQTTTVSIRVVDQHSKPIAEQPIWVYSRDAGIIKTRNHEGDFNILGDDLVEAITDNLGKVSITIPNDSRPWTLVTWSRSVGYTKYELVPDEREITLHCERNVALHGKIVTRLGDPVVGREITVRHPSIISLDAISGDDGSFEVFGVNTEPYRIDSERSAFTTTQPGSPALIIEREMRSVRGRLLDAQSGEVVRGTVNLFSDKELGRKFLLGPGRERASHEGGCLYSVVLDLPFTLIARAEDGQIARARCDRRGDQVIDLEVESPAELIVENKTGLIAMLTLEGDWGSQRMWMETDETKECSVLPGPVTLTLSFPGSALSEVTEIEARLGKTETVTFTGFDLSGSGPIAESDEALILKVYERVAELTGRRLAEEVKGTIIRDWEGDVAHESELSGVERSQRTLDFFGVAEYDQPLAGLYSPDDQSFVVDGDNLLVEAAIAHEVWHAIQDEHLRLGEFVADAQTLDAKLARFSSIEGEAYWIMEEYLNRWCRGKESASTEVRIDLHAGYGLIWARKMERLHGANWIDQSWNSPLQSTASLFEASEPVDGAELGSTLVETLRSQADSLKGWRPIEKDVVGPLFINHWLESFWGTPHSALVGWQDDEMSFFAGKEDASELTLWSTVWESDRHAELFWEAAVPWMERYGALTFVEGAEGREASSSSDGRFAMLRRNGPMVALCVCVDPRGDAEAVVRGVLD